ncbi:MAG: hypothetical protein PF630_06510 [Gammaproteobacteria bacterium]|jgi:hypothetical protein|nr:hypothetical protein [Gammaproteobacteria bacterium]
MTSFDINSIVKDIIPVRLEMYLLSTGWIENGSISDKAKVWHRPEENHFDLEILQPVNEGLKDYSQRLYEVIRNLSEYENRSPLKVISDLKNFDSDIVKIQVISPDVDSGAIPIDDGVLLFEKAKDLLVSSTLSTFTKKRFFSGSWPAVVKEFMNTLRFGQTERGSYIVNVIAPVSHFSEMEFPEADCSTTRSISNNLARSLGATMVALKNYEKTNDLFSFEGAVSSGVSANLCDAIIGMSGSSKSRDVEISIELAASEKDSQEILSKHRFTSSHIPILSAASEYYKGKFVIKNYEASGLVIRMDHEPTEDYGVIRVTSTVNGTDKNISIQLSLDDYWKAVKAHKPRLPVVCQGDLHITPRSASLADPRNFRVINNVDLFDE